MKRIDNYKDSVYGGVENKPKELFSISEYRELTGDSHSPDGQVVKRLKYLETLCRNVIKLEIENHKT